MKTTFARHGTKYACAAAIILVAAQANAQDTPVNAGESAIVQSEMGAMEARALLELGKLADAEAAAHEALASNPKNIIALQVLADIADRGNDWRLALTRWQNVNALATDPAHKRAVEKRIREIKRAHSSQANLQAYFMGDAGNDEQVGLKASAKIVRRTQPSILVGLEVRDFDAKQPFAPGETDGPPASSPLRDPISETKVRGELGIAYSIDRSDVEVAVVASQDVIGGRARYRKNLAKGAIGVEAKINTPYWAYSRGAQNEAALDYVGVNGQRYGKQFDAWGSAGVANYTVQDREDVARSFKASAGVAARMSADINSPRLTYQLDAEYFNDINLLDAPGGGRFPGLPVTDRQVHSLGVHKRFGEKPDSLGENGNYVDLGAGYRTDVEGEDGPFIDIAAGLRMSDTASLELTAQYSEVATERLNTDGYTSVFLTLKRRF